jgi:hypothetical protein
MLTLASRVLKPCLRTPVFPLAITVIATSAVLFSGCGKKDASASSSGDLTISGTLGGGAGSRTAASYNDNSRMAFDEIESLATASTALTEYGVRCVTLSGTPQAGEGTCNTSGSFSLSIAEATGVPIGCFVLKGTSVIAMVAFEGTSTGIDGQAQREGTYVAGTGATGLNFGTINVDLAKGQAIVTKAAVKEEGSSAPGTVSGTWADMTGTWQIKSGGNVPDGYAKVCPPGTQDCQGPSENETIYFAQYAATDGSGGAHTGMALWKDQSAYTSCVMGSGKGEGAQLPSGWTTSSRLQDPLALTTTIPDPLSGKPQAHGGQYLCNLKSSLVTNSTTCLSILTDTALSNGTAWAAGSSQTGAGNTGTNGIDDHWGLTPAQCSLHCSINSNWESSGSCTGEFAVDWNGFGDKLDNVTPVLSGGTSGSWTNGSVPADTSSSDFVSYLEGKVKFFTKSPKARHMFNEIMIKGATGTLTDHKEHSQTACSSTSSGGCTGQVQCQVVENIRLSLVQTSSTEARAELIMKNSLAPNMSEADKQICKNDSNAHIRESEEKMMFKLVKQ